MAVNPQKLLPARVGKLSKINNTFTKSSLSLSIKKKKIPTINKILANSSSSTNTLSENSQKNIEFIRVKVVEIDKLLKGTLASQKKELDKKKRDESSKRREKIEERLETKKNAEKGKSELPKLSRLGIFDWIKNFIGNIILGYFAVRLIDHLPKIIPIVKLIGSATDFVINLGGKLLDSLVTFIDWGYKAYDATRGFVKNLFGEGGVKQFDQLSGLLNQFLNLAIIAGMATAGAGGFRGRGRRGAATARPRLGTTGKPRITTSGGARVGGIDLRNPLRERPRITTGIGEKPQLRLPGAGAAARVTTSGGKRALLSSVRPFLKNLRVPIIGALIDFGLSVALGENPGRAAFRAIGAAILGTIGGGLAGVLGLAGGPLAVATAALGSIAGGTLGDMAGGALYDLFFAGKKPERKTSKFVGGGVTRGGKMPGAIKRTVSKGKKGRYKRKLAPQKPTSIEIKPGSDVGGKDKIFGLFPNPLEMLKDATQKVSDIVNPFKVIKNTGETLGKSDYFGPILSITSKILLGQKPDQQDYKNVGLGINMLVAKGIDDGKLKGGLAAFAAGGFVDPKTLDAISQGGDISDWVSRSFKDATETNAQKTLREIQENLRLKKAEPSTSGTEPGTGGGTAGEFSPEGLQGDIYKYLLSKGMDDSHALGIMANIHRESGFKPGVSEYGGPGVGLFQYSSGGRKDAFLKAVPDYKTNWKGQIDFALKDDVGPQYLTTKFNSPQEAADWWMRKWERPAEYIQRDKGPKIHAQYLASLEKFRTGKGYKIPTSGDFAGMDRGGVGGSLAEYITGDPNTPFGRFDKSGHGTTSNYHDHIAFRDRNTAVKAYNFFKSKGIKVTEFKGFDRVGGHATGSLHYSGLAFDVPGAQWGGSGAIGPTEYRGSSKVRSVLKDFMGGGSIPKLEKGGFTLGRSHMAILGERGKEFVIDADSTAAIEATFPGFLNAINKAKYSDAINVLRNFASYEDGAEQTILVVESPTQNISINQHNYSESGSGLIFGSEEADAFDSLYMGG